MSGITSLEILLLSMLILAFLQLQPGIFAIFMHYASAKFKHRKRSLLATFYILGVETTAACMFICMLLFANLFYMLSNPQITFGVTCGIIVVLILLAILSLTCYFRRGRGTKLFIPRHLAKALTNYAQSATTRSDAFVLGALTGVLELPFTLPLYFISAIALVLFTVALPAGQLFGLAFILAPTIPLFAIRLRYKFGANLAGILRTRFRDKVFVRFFLTLAYATLALLIAFVLLTNNVYL